MSVDQPLAALAPVRWGAATSAYQIEGAADSRQDSVWDMFCRRPDTVRGGRDGAVACDHLAHLVEDVERMAWLGLESYRFSLSWPRVLDADGRLRPAGFDVYDELVDRLCAAGIEPWITLFHWDFPLSLFHRGGWLNRDSVDWFADYAGMAAERLGDRVRNWLTINESTCFIGLGHRVGLHAPGLQLPWPELLRIGHHVHLAHGRAVRRIRAACPQARIGRAEVGVVTIPASEDPADIAAARHRMFHRDERGNHNVTWWMDPPLLGRYPDDLLALYEPDMPAGWQDDMEEIGTAIDFCGTNIYHGTIWGADADGQPVEHPRPIGAPVSQLGWPMEPRCLYWGPKFLHERYGKPIAITENGLPVADWVAPDGSIHDQARIDFYQQNLGYLARACDDGVPVDTFFAWSLMDNFEWAEGYEPRFGLFHVDYADQTRRPKASAHWYRQWIAERQGERQQQRQRTPIHAD